MAKANTPRTETHPRRRRKRKLTEEELEAYRREGEELAERRAKADRADGPAIMHAWEKLWATEED